ncbi:MAG: hypothetical protein Q9168_008052, partial [Polycauliona sp. 1 TL-2023]
MSSSPHLHDWTTLRLMLGGPSNHSTQPRNHPSSRPHAVRLAFPKVRFRALGTPLEWPEAKQAADKVRQWGIEVQRPDAQQSKASMLMAQ